jgi:hypothetical protein
MGGNASEERAKDEVTELMAGRWETVQHQEDGRVDSACFTVEEFDVVDGLSTVRRLPRHCNFLDMVGSFEVSSGRP